MNKKCGDCKKYKALSQFYKQADNKSGVQSHCKKCHNKCVTIWKKNNPKKVAKSNKKWKKENPEKAAMIHAKAVKKWLKNNRKKAIRLTKKWIKNNPEKALRTQRKAMKKYKKLHPWHRTWSNIWSRCNYPKCASYPSYGGKGIKNFLTLKDLKYLWFRDKAYLMKHPSIDRKNPKKNYTLKNCRYMELKENKARKKK